MNKKLILGIVLVIGFISVCMWGDACVMSSVDKMMNSTQSDSTKVDTVSLDTIKPL